MGKASGIVLRWRRILPEARDETQQTDAGLVNPLQGPLCLAKTQSVSLDDDFRVCLRGPDGSIRYPRLQWTGTRSLFRLPSA
jgi:hypothetical protein